MKATRYSFVKTAFSCGALVMHRMADAPGLASSVSARGAAAASRYPVPTVSLGGGGELSRVIVRSASVLGDVGSEIDCDERQARPPNRLTSNTATNPTNPI